MVAVDQIWRVLPPAATVARSLAPCALSYGLARAWPAGGAMLLVKRAAIGAAVILGAVTLREFTAADVKAVRALILWSGPDAA